MGNITKYLNLSLETLNHYEFPLSNLRFIENSELDILHRRIYDELLLNNVEADSKFSIKDSINNLPDVKEDLEKLIFGFSETITNAFSLLKNVIAPEVADLNNKITELADQRMIITYGQGNDPTINVDALNIPIIDINNLVGRVDDIDAITSVVHEKLNISGQAISILNLSKLGMFTRSNRPMGVEYAAIIEKLLETTVNSNPELDKDNICEALHLMAAGFIRESISSQSLLSAMSIIHEILPFIDVIQNAIGDLTEEEQLIATQIVDRGKLLVDIAAYVVHCLKNLSVLGKSMVHDGCDPSENARARKLGTIDTIFVDADHYQAFEASGGNISQIRKVLRTFHNSDSDDFLNSNYGGRGLPIPPTGLPAEYIKSKVADAELATLKAQAAFMRRYELVRKSALSEATITVLASYLTEFKEPVKPYDNVQQMYNQVTKIMLPALINIFRNSKDVSIEHLLYMFIMRLMYPNHIVNLVYEKLGKKYVELMDDENGLNPENILFMDCVTVVEIVTEFILEELTTTY